MSSFSDILIRKRELPRLLCELGLLLGREVREVELLSMEETETLRARASEVAHELRQKFTISFDEKQTPRWQAFFERLAQCNPSPIYVWLPLSNQCGLLPPLPLAQVRRDFPFDLNPDGILAIVTADFSDKLLLDFCNGDHGEELLEVEQYGKHWGPVVY